ncbi:MAG: type II toxin-antitoxin system HicB family antitoxin [Patescibacteria group bacterium]
MKKLRFKNVVWQEEKYYVAQCLNVDVSSFGESKKEALVNLNEALELYFEDVKLPQLVDIRRPQIVDTIFQHA